eukprot:750759-Hanusia_phi.AAC.3
MTKIDEKATSPRSATSNHGSGSARKEHGHNKIKHALHRTATTYFVITVHHRQPHHRNDSQHSRHRHRLRLVHHGEEPPYHSARVRLRVN